MIYLWIALGSALGGMGRYWLTGVISNSFGQTFPWGTLIVNVTGSLAIGFIFTATMGPGARLAVNPTFTQFMTIGICGGYTTFSSFSLQTLNLARDGEWLYAGLNVALSIVFCLAAVWLGHTLGQLLNPRL